LASAWGADRPPPPVPMDRIERLVRERYTNRAWNHER
jgi:hypothetical protein